MRDRIVTDTTQGMVTPTSAVLTAATGISPALSYHTPPPTNLVVSWSNSILEMPFLKIFFPKLLKWLLTNITHLQKNKQQNSLFLDRSSCSAF